MKETYKNAIEHSIQFIESRLSDSFSVQELAEQVFFSKTHYQRLFHAVMGEPVMEYVKKRRLQIACQKLCQTNATILAVALQNGYESHEGFTRAFKAYFGVTPMQYRRLHSKLKNKNLRKGEMEMLSSDVLNRFAQNMNAIDKMLEHFKNEGEKVSNLANTVAHKNGLQGATVVISSRELFHLTQRVENVRQEICSFIMNVNEKTVIEIFDRIYILVKSLDDITFQMNLLEYLSGIEIARIDDPKKHLSQSQEALKIYAVIC